MLKTKIDQLKVLLAEMENPNSLEYNRITTEFNKYRRTQNPDFEPPTIDHFELVYFMADKFRDFELMRQIRDKSINKDISYAAANIQVCYFYEIVNTIKRNDLFGWIWAGFDISKEEMDVLSEYRNAKFHIPEDTELFTERAKNLLQFKDRMSRITLNNSGALLKYMHLKQQTYPIIYQLLEKAFKPTRDENFLHNNFPLAKEEKSK